VSSVLSSRTGEYSSHGQNDSNRENRDQDRDKRKKKKKKQRKQKDGEGGEGEVEGTFGDWGFAGVNGRQTPTDYSDDEFYDDREPGDSNSGGQGQGYYESFMPPASGRSKGPSGGGDLPAIGVAKAPAPKSSGGGLSLPRL
jgi:hypothetical protein